MSNRIQAIIDKSGNNVLPITHERAVMDSEGTTLEAKILSFGLEINGEANVRKDFVWTAGYVNASGAVASSSTSQFCQPILFKAGEKLAYKTGSAFTNAVVKVANYDRISVGDSDFIVEQIITSPTANVKRFYEFTEDTIVVISVKTSDYSLSVTQEQDGSLKERISELQKSLDGGQINYTSGRYLYSNGNDYAGSGWCFNKDYVPIKKGDAIAWKPGAVKSDACLVLYDAEKNVMTYYTANAVERTLSISRSDVAFCRFSFAIENLDNFPLLVNDEVVWTPIKENTDGVNQKIEKIADGMIDVAQYNRDEKLPGYIDNTTYQYSTPRLNRDYIVSPAIKVSSGDKVVLTESAAIAQFTSGGSIRANASASELTITSSATAYIRVAIPKATDGFTVKINGTIVLIWSAELYEAIQASKSSDSMVHSTEESGGSRSYFPALFDGTIGNPANASLIRTELIPVAPGSTVWIRPNIELEQGQTYAFGYKTYKSDGSVWRSVDVSSNGVANQVYATTDVEYYVAFEIGVYGASNSAVAIRAATYQGILDIIVKSPAQIDAWKYRPLVGQLSYSPSMNSYQQSNPLILLHFSDLHGSAGNYRRIVGFRRVMKELIHDVISTGDNVFTSFADSFDFWSDRTVLNVIGNHDTAKLEGSSYDWTYYAGKQAYDRYFAPFISHWGVIQPENAEEQGYCYYYKDYTAQGIRLIVLDVMGWDATQLAWFAGVLSDAITNSLSVVVAIHGPAKTEVVTPMISGWMSYFGWSGSSDTIPDDAISAIDSFIESDGKFICWLTGHTHRDQLGYLAEHHNQLCVVIGTATINTTNAGYGDSYRRVYDESQDLFNVIAFDAKEHQVRVVRVGATTNKHFQMRHTLVVSYSEDGSAVPTIVSES